MENSILALDAGQTGIRSLLLDRDRSERDFPGIRTDLELFPQLAKVILDLLESHSAPVTLAIGMTGLTRAQSRPDALLRLLNNKVDKIFLAHDSITGYLGSIGLSQGTVTAAGTGVVTMAVGPEKFARVDGWGNLIGDAGSAYWIGRAGLEAGMKAYDGRSPQTELTQILWNNFTNPEEAYIELQTDSNRVALIASFARHVIDLADSDSAALRIVENAGYELALSAATAARQAGLLAGNQPVFSWAGNLMKAEHLREAFTRNLISMVPNASVIQPNREPIDGVALLPHLPTDSPLLEAVYVAN